VGQEDIVTDDERFRRQVASMEKELMLAAVRQHELRESVEKLKAELEAKNARLVREIAGRKRAEKEALRMQKLDSLRILAGGIAHDLNNIMVAVEANAGLALKAVGSDSPASDYLIGIEKASEKVVAFSKQIRSFTGKAETEKEPVQLNEVIKDTVALLLASISNKADLECSLPDDLPIIIANPQNMQQVVMNLIINASDALGKDHGTIKVSTGKICADRGYLDSLNPTGLPEGDYIYFEVSDTGCGMSLETRRRIFEPFYTTKFTGRGLGLSAVLRIVSVHGGAIGLESKEGQGTTFRVLLPLPAKPVEVAATKPVSEDVWRGKGTILLVDDDKDILLMAKMVLETAGYNVLAAEDGPRAIEIFREKANSISAVITDQIMPLVRGDEVAKEVRKMRGDINILLLSGFNEIDLTDISGGPGNTAFLEKPYKVTRLLEAVQDILKT
jgi:signal transduction histidine kinase